LTEETSSPDRSPGSRIAVIEKAVRAMDAVLAHDGLTPTEVAAAIETNRSTAFRLLTSLEHVGLLSRDATGGRYRLGVKLLQYSEAVRAGLSIIDVADPTMRQLRDETRQSVLLSIREGWGARCIHRLSGPEVDVLSWATGEWLPMHIGAAPQALLSSLSESELERYLAYGGDWQTRHGQRSAQEIRDGVGEIRARGWALNREGLTRGVASLGAVIQDSSGVAVCAISVAGLEHHYIGDELERTAQRVIAAGAEIRHRLIA
jgi:DNA-binding IclR family transcriptional regulator